MSRSVRALAALASVVITGGLVVQAAGKPAPDIPIAITLADNIQGYPLRIASDGQGAYVNTTQVSSMLQVLAGGTDVMLYTYYTKRGGYAPSNRGFRIDLSEQDTSGDFAAPVLAPTVPVHLKVHCSGEGVDMLRIGLGQSVTCPGGLRFWQLTSPSAGNWYRLSFQPDNYPEVDRFAVRCAAADGTGCRRWDISPAGGRITLADPLPKNYTRLLQIDESGSNVLAEGGTYFVSFAMTVSR